MYPGEDGVFPGSKSWLCSPTLRLSGCRARRLEQQDSAARGVEYKVPVADSQDLVPPTNWWFNLCRATSGTLREQEGYPAPLPDDQDATTIGTPVI
jgi:hypothetical protein